MKKHNVILDNDGEKLKITTILPQSEVFVVHIDLDNPVLEKWVIRVGESSGKIEVDLEKRDKLRWQSLGSPLEHHLWFGLRKVINLLLHISCQMNYLLHHHYILHKTH